MLIFFCVLVGMNNVKLQCYCYLICMLGHGPIQSDWSTEGLEDRVSTVLSGYWIAHMAQMYLQEGHKKVEKSFTWS